MPVLLLKPATDTTPGVISAGGAAVRFTVTAKCPSGAQQARFTFRLKGADGYEWSTGGTTVQATAGVDEQWRDRSFTLTLTRVRNKSAKLLLIEVNGELVAGSAVKQSWASLTINDPLTALMTAYRTDSALTQGEMADTLGVSSSWVGKLEAGASPSHELLKTLKETLESKP